jgi:hypothetical protein
VAAKAATCCGVSGTLAESGEAGLGNVKRIGPFSPAGASWMCAASAEGTLCVHCTSMAVAGLFRSAVQVAVEAVPFGGSACAPSAVNGTRSTVRGRICPRISPDGRPEVWMLT